jgi:oxygen-independent coproporphyrinogen-3 oxidase
MIYIHIPFCHRKCIYCAFYSAVTREGYEAYVDAVCRELTMWSYKMEQPVRTVYMGGGTPTVLDTMQLGKIVECIKSHYDVGGLEEVTIEANPEDLTPGYLERLRGLAFFNRISIGIQSFSDDDLRLLNRRHNARQARMAVENAYKAGFENISVDLIYGLPNQSAEGWQANLDLVSQLPVTHLSAYALTVEPGTILASQVERGTVEPGGEEMALKHYGLLKHWAEKEGFLQYEISNFCKPGFRAIHNSRYWNRTPYLGIGAAAHSFDGTHRRWNVADWKEYVEGAMAGRIAHEEEELTLKDAYNEYLMVSLRTVDGIDKSCLDAPFALRLEKDIARYVDAGWVEDTPTHYRPTAEGLLHADGMAAELFVE